MEEIIAKKGRVVIGIGGISGSGKAQISQELADNLGATVFNIKSYSNGPVYKRDQKGRIWEDWEDPRCYDLNAFYEDIKSARET